MTICFDGSETSVRELKRRIESTGFKARRRRAKRREAPDLPITLELPKDAPDFLRLAFERARSKERPLVLDFHAPWCGPCRKFESVTFADPAVGRALDRLVLVRINLDEHPKLATRYGVTSVPHLILADRSGRIAERVTNYEPPSTFLKRLEALLD